MSVIDKAPEGVTLSEAVKNGPKINWRVFTIASIGTAPGFVDSRG